MIVALIVCPSTFSGTDVLFRPLQVAALQQGELHLSIDIRGPVIVGIGRPIEDVDRDALFPAHHSCLPQSPSPGASPRPSQRSIPARRSGSPPRSRIESRYSRRGSGTHPAEG